VTWVPFVASLFGLAADREKVATMTRDRRGSAVVQFPDELEILITREFDAPTALVFDVLTEPEHVRKWGATHPDRMLECSIDLRVGGMYHSSFETADGTVFSFSGTYLEVEPPIRTAETWRFEADRAVEAVETMDLHETDGVTTLSWKLAFQDTAARARMTSFDGRQDSLDKIEEILRSLAPE
jgi:uncharacterized protein YndB with AHSA1/START domain